MNLKRPLLDLGSEVAVGQETVDTNMAILSTHQDPMMLPQPLQSTQRALIMQKIAQEEYNSCNVASSSKESVSQAEQYIHVDKVFP